MERIIRVTYNPLPIQNGILPQQYRDYYTNNDTLHEAITAVRIAIQSTLSKLNITEIVSIVEINDGITIS
jgi:hypothetical protein